MDRLEQFLGEGGLETEVPQTTFSMPGNTEVMETEFLEDNGPPLHVPETSFGMTANGEEVKAGFLKSPLFIGLAVLGVGLIAYNMMTGRRGGRR